MVSFAPAPDPHLRSSLEVPGGPQKTAETVQKLTETRPKVSKSLPPQSSRAGGKTWQRSTIAANRAPPWGVACFRRGSGSVPRCRPGAVRARPLEDGVLSQTTKLKFEPRESRLEVLWPSGALLVATAGRSAKNWSVWTPGMGPESRLSGVWAISSRREKTHYGMFLAVSAYSLPASASWRAWGRGRVRGFRPRPLLSAGRLIEHLADERSSQLASTRLRKNPIETLRCRQVVTRPRLETLVFGVPAYPAVNRCASTPLLQRGIQEIIPLPLPPPFAPHYLFLPPLLVSLGGIG